MNHLPSRVHWSVGNYRLSYVDLVYWNSWNISLWNIQKPHVSISGWSPESFNIGTLSSSERQIQVSPNSNFSWKLKCYHRWQILSVIFPEATCSFHYFPGNIWWIPKVGSVHLNKNGVPWRKVASASYNSNNCTIAFPQGG